MATYCSLGRQLLQVGCFQKVQRITLWVVTIIAIIFISFPYLLPYLPVEWFY